MAKTIAQAELAKHNALGNMWMAVDGYVYDVSKFAKVHPGGPDILEKYAGMDVTSEFYELHRKEVLDKYAKLRIGRLEGSKEAVAQNGALTDVPIFEIPAFLKSGKSPYYKDSHRRLTEAIRGFVEKELTPIAETMDLAGEYTDTELRQKMGAFGLVGTRLGPGPWIKHMGELGIQIPGGVPPEEFDYFHEMLSHVEVARVGRPGFIDALGMGFNISAPAIYHFGTDEMRKTIGAQLLRGDKWSALAITEPFCGSDVAALRTSAVKTPDGKSYCVNGIKKWITEGAYADYFVTPVRTGTTGKRSDISMLLVERGPGLETKQMKTTYSTCAGTALVFYRNCMVPVENLMGKEGGGFKQVMYNFNHERWMMCCNLIGQARTAVSDAFMWARQRSVFGKSLIEQPVIRFKLGQASANLEGLQTFLESVTYTMCHTEGGALGDALAGPIATMKFQTTRTCWSIADDCVQILGGRGITRTGMGGKVEGFKNYCKYAAVYGGSEEIMAELSVKQGMKNFPATAKL